MTGPATGEPDRSSAAPHRTSGTRERSQRDPHPSRARVRPPAHHRIHLPGSGFRIDLDAFRLWAIQARRAGPGRLLQARLLHRLHARLPLRPVAVGIIEKSLPSLDLIKIPAILADIGIAGLVWSMVQELGGGRRAALVGAGLVLVIPVTWFDSVVWGQVDSVGLVFLLLAIRDLWRDRPELAVVFTVIAAIIKTQLGGSSSRSWRRSSCGGYLWDAGRPTGPRGAALRRGCSTSLARRPRRRPAILRALPVRPVDTRSHRAGPQDRRRLSVPHRQRLQPLGARHARRRRVRRRAASGSATSITATAADTPCLPGSRSLVGPFPARSSSGRAARRHRDRRRPAGRPAARPPDDPRRAGRARDRVLRRCRPASTSATCSRSSPSAAILAGVSRRWRSPTSCSPRRRSPTCTSS